MQIEEPIIEFKDVRFEYGNQTILEDISFKVQKGDFLGIVGPNGSGKSTLLKLLLGLLKPSQGSINLFGEELSKFRSWHKIGYVPQKAVQVENRLPITVQEVVSLRLREKTRPGAVEEALKKTDMLEHRNRLLRELSGGQQQRVHIAKALVSNPELLVLDEPTTGVDAEQQDKFYKMLSEFNEKGMSLIMVSHDLDVVANKVNKLLCVNKELIYQGPPDEFMDEEYLHKMHGEHGRIILHKH